ncbi:MAG: thioredoxin [Clostridia bacterium]|nr:thioredoxin [Clostridia bacterium]
MAVTHITSQNFQSEVMQSSVPVLIDFWATWCAPCRMIGPIIEEVAEARPDVKVCKVNVDEEPMLAEMFQVVSIPLLVVVKDGKITNKALGLMPMESILELL